MIMQRFNPITARFFASLFACLAIMLCLSLSAPQAYADDPTTGVDLSNSASCAMSSYGFSVGLVYCIENAICNATVGVDCNSTGSLNNSSGFIQKLNSFLLSYQMAILALSITFFGLRIMTMGTDQILRESALLLFKIAIGLFVAQNAPWLFLSLTGAMNELVGWVSGTSGIGFFALTPHCSVDTLPPGFDGQQFKVWQMFDCIMLALTGVSASPNAILGGMLMLLVPALFSGVVGAIVFFIGVTAIFTVLSLLLRALSLVLMSYITMAFLWIFAPIIAPLFMFHQKFTTELFEKWVGLVVSTVFQPVIVIAFLAISVSILDTFIEGEGASGTTGTSCTSSATAGGSTVTICSYNEWLAIACPTSSTTATTVPTTPTTPTAGGTTTTNPLSSQATAIQNCTQPNVTFFSWLLTGDPQLNSSNGSYWNPNTMGKWVKSGVVNATNVMRSYAANALAGTGPPRLIPSAQQVLIPFALTLVTFLIVSIILSQMMKVIPSMARMISTSTGLGLAFVKLPLEGALESAGEQMRTGMMAAAQGKDITAAGSIARAGASGAFQGFLSGLDK